MADTVETIITLVSTGEWRLLLAALLTFAMWALKRAPGVDRWLCTDAGWLTSSRKKLFTVAFLSFLPAAELLADTGVSLRQVAVSVATIALGSMGLHSGGRAARKRRVPRGLAVLLVFALGCSASQQVTTADVAAQAANGALPELVATYEREQMTALDRADGDGAERVLAVRARWRPVWAAWEFARAAQDSWATALESGADSGEAMAAYMRALCSFASAANGFAPPDVLVALEVLPCPR